MMNLHANFQLKMLIHDRDNGWKPLIKSNFLSPRGITLTGTKFQLDLSILMMNLHTEFQIEMSMHNRDNERKPRINKMNLRPRDITQPKIIRPELNSNLTCVFALRTYILNFNSKCQCMTEMISGNHELIENF